MNIPYLHYIENENKFTYFYNGIMVIANKGKIEIMYSFQKELNEKKNIFNEVINERNIFKYIAYAINKMIIYTKREIHELEIDILNHAKKEFNFDTKFFPSIS